MLNIFHKIQLHKIISLFKITDNENINSKIVSVQ